MRTLIVAGLLLASSAISPQAIGSVFVAVSIDDLAKHASTVAVVKAVEQVSEWRDGRIVTRTRAVVEDVVAQAGDESVPQESTMTIETFGGVVDGIGSVVEGEARLDLGRRFLVFATRQERKTKTWRIVAHAQGAFQIDSEKVLRLGSLGHLVPQALPTPAVRPSGTLAIELSGKRVQVVVPMILEAWTKAHGGHP